MNVSIPYNSLYRQPWGRDKCSYTTILLSYPSFYFNPILIHDHILTNWMDLSIIFLPFLLISESTEVDKCTLFCLLLFYFELQSPVVSLLKYPLIWSHIEYLVFYGWTEVSYIFNYLTRLKKYHQWSYFLREYIMRD